MHNFLSRESCEYHWLVGIKQVPGQIPFDKSQGVSRNLTTPPPKLEILFEFESLLTRHISIQDGVILKIVL